jgi:hypothetical protein
LIEDGWALNEAHGGVNVDKRVLHSAEDRWIVEFRSGQ